MVVFKRGNIFDEKDADALVNPVNCIGVMGAGLALQFRKRYPEMFQSYREACEASNVHIGRMWVYKANGHFPRYIINFPTKQHWRNPSKLEYIQTGLHDLIRILKDLKIGKVAIPPLGCGLGGLPWGVVRKMIVDALQDVPEIEVVVFEP